MHQRSCKTFKNLNNSINSPKDPNEDFIILTPSNTTTAELPQLSLPPHHRATPSTSSAGVAAAEIPLPSSPLHQVTSPSSSSSTNTVIKDTPLPGIKLPKTTTQWSEANAYFHSQKSALPNITDIDNFTINFQSSIYNYFASTYGTIKQQTNSTTISDKPINKLKKELKQLKLLGRNNHNFDLQIKTLSKQIRSRIASTKRNKLEKTLNITNQLKHKFWATYEKLFNPTPNLLPQFGVDKCKQFFNNILNDQSCNKHSLPNWIKTLPNPSIACDTNPPTYNEISSIIRKCKSRASPCPLDQMSVIVLKKCPIFRTILYQLLVECFQTFYALKTLRSHGLRGTKLFDITESLIISRIKYAAPSWSGFAT
ncbi:hypothetical protein HELRODRAFT_182645 [Helobdella robusta]|uniref:Reverse transcriptase domain-containing protein n=1 Tax=Helobdella robusta TaxID=6412 RepID=T1FIJ2_HELRO|nr:hypothetical protein HELRODRAFT_182645 [Helobdella robusta]ESN90811.1 hypothetical protein HELRODRAFT_182645 [Helobdella robusta]